MQAYADLIHEADPRFKVAITVDFDEAGNSKYLYGHLNTYVASFHTFDPIKQKEREGHGDHFWTYTALIQNAENPTPFWMIEFPFLNLRIGPWINFRYHVEGLLYWTTSYWNEVRARGGNRGRTPAPSTNMAAVITATAYSSIPAKKQTTAFLAAPMESYRRPRCTVPFPVSASKRFGTVWKTMNY